MDVLNKAMKWVNNLEVMIHLMDHLFHKDYYNLIYGNKKEDKYNYQVGMIGMI